jgi:taurine dioxygenase
MDKVAKVLEQIRIEPLTDHLGVRLDGIDFESVADDPGFTRLMKQLLDEHLLVFIPKQKIQPNTAERFVSNFGPLLDIKRAGNVAHHVPGAPWIKVISNGKAPDGIPYGDGNASAQIWHSDSTTWEAPVGHIAFYCRQTVDPAPKTSFKNMIEVYKALPQVMKDRIINLRVIHHFYPRQIEVKIHADGPSMPLEDRKSGFAHPLVRRHVGNNQAFLYLPTRRDSLVQGWSEQESRDLLEALWEFTNQCDFDAGVALQPDDFVIWDNRATVHGRDGWPEEHTRIMWHISSEGEIPTPLSTKRGVNTIGLDPGQAKQATQAIYNDY